MAYKGKFHPKNPQKYAGDPNNIIYRSTWECKFMNYLDREQSIIKWSSEELTVPYYSPVDKKWHRYFPDFVVQYMNSEGLGTMMVEIKPKRQTKAPEPRKKMTRAYLSEMATWGVNEAKWKAATEYCLDRGWKFKILTEDDLGIR